MKKLFLLFLSGLFLLCIAGVVNASIMNKNSDFSPVKVVDGGSGSGSDEIEITDFGIIKDLNVWIDFTKVDSPAGDPSNIDSNGDILGVGGASFANEIIFTLYSPKGTGKKVKLIEENSLPYSTSKQ